MSTNKNNNITLMMDGILPWDNLPGDRARQWSILLILTLLCLLLIVVIERTPHIKPDRHAEQKVPERLAKLVMERKKVEPPPPPPPPEEKPEEKKEEPKPEEKPKEEPKPKEVEKAREKARKEVKVFDDALAGLRDIAPVVSNQPLRKGGGESTKIETSRNLITSRAGSGSGGIAVSNVSSGGGGGGTLQTGQVAQVKSNINEEASTTKRSADGKSRRTDEQIRRVFDRYAGRFNSVYQRELRSNPALQGTVVISLTIAPDGSVSKASIKSSELNDSGLERKILLIVQTMDFGALKVEPWTGNWPINFFPG